MNGTSVLCSTENHYEGHGGAVMRMLGRGAMKGAHVKPATMLASLRRSRRLSSLTKVSRCRAKRNLRRIWVLLSVPTSCAVLSIKTLMSDTKWVFSTCTDTGEATGNTAKYL